MRTEEITEMFDAPPPRSRFRRYIVAFLALVSVAGIVAIAIVARSAPDALAEVRVRDDTVGVRHGSGDYIAASEGENLGAGDVVRTDGTGQAQIDLFDGSLMRLDGETEVAVRELVDRPEGHAVAFELSGGRVWNRVAELTSEGDRFEVRMGNAVARVRGTTFMVDCRTKSTCYVVGVSGSTVVESSGGEQRTVADGGCVVASESALSVCDEKKLGLIDGWVKENLADDEQLALERAAATPQAPEVTTAPSSTRAPDPVSRPIPTATPTPTAKPTPTPTPKETAEPTTRPKRTPKITPAPSPCESGQPDGDCFPDPTPSTGPPTPTPTP